MNNRNNATTEKLLGYFLALVGAFKAMPNHDLKSGDRRTLAKPLIRVLKSTPKESREALATALMNALKETREPTMESFFNGLQSIPAAKTARMLPFVRSSLLNAPEEALLLIKRRLLSVLVAQARLPQAEDLSAVLEKVYQDFMAVLMSALQDAANLPQEKTDPDNLPPGPDLESFTDKF